MRPWELVLQGGAYDGWVGETDEQPRIVLIAWSCSRGCEGHATMNPDDPGIVLRTSESYRRVGLDYQNRLAVYEIGEGAPDKMVDEREVVGAGSHSSSGWPGAPAPWLQPWRRGWANS